MLQKYLSLMMMALFATLVFSLTSCGDDKDDEPQASGELIGTWQESSELSTILDVKSFVQFNPDNTYIEVNDYGGGDVDILRGKWSRDGNTIKVYGDDIPTVTAQIKELTSSKLTIETAGIPTVYKRVDSSKIDIYLK